MGECWWEDWEMMVELACNRWFKKMRMKVNGNLNKNIKKY